MSKKIPGIEALVVNAIRQLQSVQGSTTKEITSFLAQKCNLTGPDIKRAIQLTIKRGLNYGILQRSKKGFVTCDRSNIPEPLEPEQNHPECIGCKHSVCFTTARSRSRRRRGHSAMRKHRGRHSRRGGRSRSRRHGRRHARRARSRRAFAVRRTATRKVPRKPSKKQMSENQRAKNATGEERPTSGSRQRSTSKGQVPETGQQQ